MNLLEIKAIVIGPVESVDGRCSVQVAGLTRVCAGCGAITGEPVMPVDNNRCVECTPG